MDRGVFTPEEAVEELSEPGSLVSPKLWQMVGLWDSEAPDDVAENHDRYLVERFEEESRKCLQVF
jgi:hypothetical protein